MNQFLLNPDGTLPANVDVKALQAAGVRFVMPTPPPTVASPSMIVQDTEPELVNGIWHQRWIEVPAPPVASPEPEDV